MGETFSKITGSKTEIPGTGNTPAELGKLGYSNADIRSMQHTAGQTAFSDKLRSAGQSLAGLLGPQQPRTPQRTNNWSPMPVDDSAPDLSFLFNDNTDPYDPFMG